MNAPLHTARFGRTTLTLLQGDITQQEVDAIVNAANARLAGGGGVDGAIHRAGGPEIMKECDAIRQASGGCPTGQAVVTTGGKLKAKHVIHTVGPVWSDAKASECDELLASAYRTSLARAAEIAAKSVAFPSISTGVYAFPVDRAAGIALKTVRSTADELGIADVRFVLFSESILTTFAQALASLSSSSTGQ